ncbi:MAG: 16S rRNA (cytidine(1402)-2'-O)-methyltransferase [Deferrisomatales bacterium]
MTDSELFPPGSLAVVALPLGNPADITLRALEVLRAADRIAAEDTRTVGRFLAAHGIRSRLISYHDWNEAQRTATLVEMLAAGERVALVSEAGTPGISDPGYDLVRRARRQGYRVFPVPGPSALTGFLSAAGLPTDAFTFCGFPPSRPAKRRERFAALAGREETLVFYESPRRILAALGDALWAFGDRECALAREMTKPHEEFLWGPLSQVRAALEGRPRVRGEICWGVRGAGRAGGGALLPLEAAVDQVLARDLAPRQAAREVSRLAGVSAKEAYAAVLAHKGRRPA